MPQYETQEIWFGQAYRGAKIENIEERERRINKIIGLSNECLSEIKEIVGGEFMSHMFGDREIKEVTDVGTHIIFPLLTFENLSKVCFECRIRINPCPERKEHYSKTWVIIGTDSIQTSGELKDFFDYIEQYARDIGRRIKNIVYEAEDIPDDVLRETEYPITIRNIGSSKISSENSIFRLFETENKKEADKLLKETEVRDVIRDLLSLYGKNGKELSLSELQETGIRWKPMKTYSHLGETSFIYGCDLKDDYAQIAGFSNVGTLKYLHAFFKPTVLQIIHGL